jgi:hypothetical protein
MPEQIQHLGYLGNNVPEEYLVTITSFTQWHGPEGLAQAIGKGAKQVNTLLSPYAEYIKSGGNKEVFRREVSTKSGVAKSEEKASTYRVIIKAPIQEKVTFRTESNWTPSSAQALLRTTFSQGIEALTGRTLISRFLSRRQWAGTSPLDFTLNLLFAANSNPLIEVILPAIEIQRMILPFAGEYSLGEWFLAPPGPDPFYIDSLPDLRNPGEIINVRIGKFMNIRKVIVKDATIEFAPRFIQGGAPLAINIAVHFQTFEIQTKESLSKEIFEAREGIEYNMTQEPLQDPMTAFNEV